VTVVVGPAVRPLAGVVVRVVVRVVGLGASLAAAVRARYGVVDGQHLTGRGVDRDAVEPAGVLGELAGSGGEQVAEAGDLGQLEITALQHRVRHHDRDVGAADDEVDRLTVQAGRRPSGDSAAGGEVGKKGQQLDGSVGLALLAAAAVALEVLHRLRALLDHAVRQQQLRVRALDRQGRGTRTRLPQADPASLGNTLTLLLGGPHVVEQSHGPELRLELARSRPAVAVGAVGAPREGLLQHEQRLLVVVGPLSDLVEQRAHVLVGEPAALDELGELR
jgi:hypothetical protein